MRVRVGSPSLLQQLNRLPASLVDERIEWVDGSKVADRGAPGAAPCHAVLCEEDGWLVLRMGDERLPSQPGGALLAHALAATGFAGEMLDAGATDGAFRAIDLDAARLRAGSTRGYAVGATGSARGEQKSGGAGA